MIIRRHATAAFLAAMTAAMHSAVASLAPQEKPVPAIALGAPFRDNAILQQERDLPVWGWGNPGATITVEFAGQKEGAMAGADGRRMLRTKPPTASAAPLQHPAFPEPGQNNVGHSPAEYAAELEVCARGVPATHGLENQIRKIT